MATSLHTNLPLSSPAISRKATASHFRFSLSKHHISKPNTNFLAFLTQKSKTVHLQIQIQHSWTDIRIMKTMTITATRLNFCSVIYDRFFPGGSWWNLSDAKQAENTTAKPITVRVFLSRTWVLIGRDKCLVYVAVASSIVAVVSKISKPSKLAEAIFFCSEREAVVFSKSNRLLVLLCVSSGIFSGTRSGCFSIANTILINCLWETLYSALVFQDISFSTLNQLVA